MTFRKIAGDRLKILLTAEDMELLCLTYEQLDYADEQTREAILSLLELGCDETGFDPGDNRLFVEAYPWDGEGCVLYFSVISNSEKPSRPKRAVYGQVIYAFDDLDLLIDGAVRLFRMYCHRIYKSSLYRLDGGYRLILYPFDPTDSHTTGFLSEYGQLVGEGEIAAAFVREHGTPVIEDNAIDKLAYYLAPNQGPGEISG